jgi:hypothetical protein
MRRARWRTRWVWSTAVIVTAVAVSGALDLAAAQSRREIPTITAT